MSCSDGPIFSRGDWEEAVRVLRQQESPDGPIVAVVAGVLVRFGHRDARYPRQIRFDDPRWGVLWVAVVMGDQVLCVDLETHDCIGVLSALSECPTEVIVAELMRASLGGAL